MATVLALRVILLVAAIVFDAVVIVPRNRAR